MRNLPRVSSYIPATQCLFFGKFAVYYAKTDESCALVRFLLCFDSFSPEGADRHQLITILTSTLKVYPPELPPTQVGVSLYSRVFHS